MSSAGAALSSCCSARAATITPSEREFSAAAAPPHPAQGAGLPTMRRQLWYQPMHSHDDSSGLTWWGGGRGKEKERGGGGEEGEDEEQGRGGGGGCVAGEGTGQEGREAGRQIRRRGARGTGTDEYLASSLALARSLAFPLPPPPSPPSPPTAPPSPLCLSLSLCPLSLSHALALATRSLPCALSMFAFITHNKDARD